MKESLASRKSRIALSAENQRLRVELKELRAEIEELRSQYEIHIHDVYEYSMFGGECVTFETGRPK
jgi:archaellum component FlaC